MPRWDTEIPVIRRERPEIQVLTCHDEYLLHTCFDVDGMVVGYGNVVPRDLTEMIAIGKARDYPRARAIHDKLLPVTKNIYHRGSHREGTSALKHVLVAREFGGCDGPVAVAAARGQGGVGDSCDGQVGAVERGCTIAGYFH